MGGGLMVRMGRVRLSRVIGIDVWGGELGGSRGA